MAFIEPAKARAIVVEGSDGFELLIPNKRNWFAILFLSAWLCGWLMGEITVPSAFFSGTGDMGGKAFIAVWLVMWTLGGGFAIFALLWMISGRERIYLGRGRLSIRREILGRGLLGEYDTSHLRNLRVSPSPYNPFDFRSSFRMWGIGGGTIAFDYGASTIRFGAGLDEGEAKSVTDRLIANGRLS